MPVATGAKDPDGLFGRTSPSRRLGQEGRRELSWWEPRQETAAAPAHGDGRDEGRTRVASPAQEAPQLLPPPELGPGWGASGI